MKSSKRPEKGQGVMMQAKPKPYVPHPYPFGKGDTVTISAEGKKLAANMKV